MSRHPTPQATRGKPSPRFALRPTAVAVHLLLAGAAIGGWVGAAQAQTATAASTRSYNIPAGPLNVVLTRFLGESGVLLSGSTELAQGKQSPGVQGNLTPDAALSALLAGTGLQAVVDAEGRYVLRVAPVVTRSGEAQLATVTVRASADTVFEGSAAEGYRVSRSAVAGFTEQSLKDTPFSVKVVPAELMHNRDMADAGKLDQMDAAVSNSYSEWYSQQFIRGFSISTANNYLRNGIPYTTFRSIGLENKERIEVLKGLSGLQLGFANPGGVVSYVTKKPADVTNLHLSVNEFGNAKTHLDLGRMVSDSLGFRINAVVEHQDSHIDKVSGPRQFFSGAVTWKPTSETTVDLDVEYEKRSKLSQTALGLTTGGGFPPMPDGKTFLGQDWAKFESEATTVEARLEHHLNPDWKVTLQANHFDMTRVNDWIGFGGIDGATGDVATVMFWGSNDNYKSSSARLMAQGTLQTGVVKHRLAFGYDRAYSYFDWSKAVWNGDIGDTNLFNPVPLARPAAGSIAGKSETVRSGVFVQDVLALGGQWDLHLSGRQATLDQQTEGYKKSTFTPSAALLFKPRPELSAYVSYVEGLEQGGTAPNSTTNANEQMKPLVSKQWETGLKGEVGLLNWEASLFQITKVAEYTNTANTYVQSGKQRHQGVELSLSGKVSREVTLYGGLMWLDAKLKETGDAATNGKRPTGVAEQRAVLTAEYAPATLSGWTFMANWTHTGKRAVNSTNTAFAPAYDLFGVGLRNQRKLADQDTTFRLGVDNLFDKRHWANVDDDFLVAGAPRTVWASMSVKF